VPLFSPIASSRVGASGRRSSKCRLRLGSIVLSVVVVATLAIAACGAPDAGPFESDGSALASLANRTVDRSTDVPAIANVDRIALIGAAAAASFDRPSGEIIRRTMVGYGGIGVEWVTYLDWDGETGRSSQEMVVDDRYLSNSQVREFVDSTNRELALEDRDLSGDGLREAMATAERGVNELLDGITPEPAGLGWWEGSTGGDMDPQTLWLVIVDGRLRSITRRAEVVGSVVSDEWKFSE